MPNLDGVDYGYDEAGMREYMKAKNAKSKAKYGRSHFPINEAPDGEEIEDDNKFKFNRNTDQDNTNVIKSIENLTKDVKNDNITDNEDADGDGIPDSYVSSKVREGNLKQEGWKRYFNKPQLDPTKEGFNVRGGVDLELAADDFKKNIKSGKYVEDAKEFGNKFLDTATGIWKGGKNTNQSLTDKVIPTKYEFGGRVKGIGGASNMNVPGMINGNIKK